MKRYVTEFANNTKLSGKLGDENYLDIIRMNNQICYIVDMCRKGHITDFEAVELIAQERRNLEKTSTAKKLWREFGDVPMDPVTECIEEPWNEFPAGTHREDIWHWFEDTFGISVAKDLMGQ